MNVSQLFAEEHEHLINELDHVKRVNRDLRCKLKRKFQSIQDSSFDEKQRLNLKEKQKRVVINENLLFKSSCYRIFLPRFVNTETRYCLGCENQFKISVKGNGFLPYLTHCNLNVNGV